MKNIEKLVRRFREAIDVAAEKDEFYRIPPFSNFPRDCCDLTCDLLQYYLSEYGIEVKQVNGEYWDTKDRLSRHHVWLKLDENIVIDITGDQFNKEFGRLYYMDSVYIGEEIRTHKKFCERKPQAYTSFMNPDEYTGFGKTPSLRQKTLKLLFDIISQYL